jgi:hypothetical protein
MERLGVVLIVLTLPLAADDGTKATLSATQTERFTVTAPGTIRLKNSFGELEIEGWDRPKVEVTTVRTTEHLYAGNERGRAQRRLDQVQIMSKQNANDVVITTVYPRRNRFVHPLSQHRDIEISYRIKAPRASKLFIDHNSGGVDIYDITGDIHTAVANGQITLAIPAGGDYHIDARSVLGDVYSDFEGRERRLNFLGNGFRRQGTAPATNLYLRVHVGDIVIDQINSSPSR